MEIKFCHANVFIFLYMIFMYIGNLICIGDMVYMYSVKI